MEINSGVWLQSKFPARKEPGYTACFPDLVKLMWTHPSKGALGEAEVGQKCSSLSWQNLAESWAGGGGCAHLN